MTPMSAIEPLHDPATAADHLLDARSLIVRVQVSVLPGQRGFELAQTVLCAVDDLLAEVRR